jgi:hypothetical protein
MAKWKIYMDMWLALSFHCRPNRSEEHDCQFFYQNGMNINNHQQLAKWLPNFFRDFQACRVDSPPSRHESRQEIDCSKIASLFDSLKQPLIDTRISAHDCNPWEVAGLKRDEVRNCAVLAWILNPKGSHGLGSAPLSALLNKLSSHFDADFPEHTGKYCFVRAESNPDGQLTNRVDIEIDCENFYLLIEVKIDATEGPWQLERYGDISSILAGSRPWAIVFLTPEGRPATSAGKHEGMVVPISWRTLSKTIQKTLSARQLIRPKGLDQVMAEQVVIRFLKGVSKL